VRFSIEPNPFQNLDESGGRLLQSTPGEGRQERFQPRKKRRFFRAGENPSVLHGWLVPKKQSANWLASNDL
jgi:hypothetical protein